MRAELQCLANVAVDHGASRHNVASSFMHNKATL